MQQLYLAGSRIGCADCGDVHIMYMQIERDNNHLNYSHDNAYYLTSEEGLSKTSYG